MELVVVKEPGKAPEKRRLPDLCLQAMQEIVGGLIERVTLDTGKDDIWDVWSNEEAKLERMTPNLACMHEGKLFDVVCGVVCVCKADDEGASIGLTDQEANAVIAELCRLTLKPHAVEFYALQISAMF